MILLALSVQVVSAFSVSTISIDPSGYLIPGTPVIVSLKIDFVATGGETFPSSSTLQMITDLENPKWTWTRLLNGVENPQPQAGGKMLELTGWDLSYPSAVEESVRITLEGVAPSVTSTTDKIIVKIQEVDSRNNIVTSSKVEYTRLVVPTTVPKTVPTTVPTVPIVSSVSPTTGTLSITSSPSGADIYVDGSNWGRTTPTTLSFLIPGSYTIKLSKTGYNNYIASTIVYAGKTTTVNWQLNPITTVPTIATPTPSPGFGSPDLSGLIILLIIGVVVVAGGYIGYSRIIRSKEEKPPSPPAVTSQKEKITEPKPDTIQRRTKQTILNQINEIQKNPAISSSTKSKLNAIINLIRGINLAETEHRLKTYANKQLDSINNTLNRIHQKGVVFTRSPDSIQQMIDAEKYVEAIVESDKFLAYIAQSEEIYDKATAYKTAMPDPDLVSLYNAGEYASVIKVYEEKQAFIANAKPELTLSLDRTQLSTERWHKLGITLTNTGLADVENVAFAFSSEFETKGIKPISVKAGKSSRTDISIIPKNVGNILLEITLTYKDIQSRDYRTVQEFWIDVVEKGTTTIPHSETPSSPVSQFTPKPLTPKQLPPELSDRYTESEFIGKGGFARVFKAKRKDGKLVAVKIPISMDAVTGKSFIAEMQNWTKLSHPNIVRLHDFNIMPMPFFEEELCDNALADQNKPIDSEEAAWILFNICEGLKFAHAQKIIHRDLKPQNILLKNGVPKISDWGLSRIISVTTTTSAMSFTPYYAAPEQIGNKVKDERTDIWQLGVILYELVTGEFPFNGDSMIEIGMNIATKDPKRPGEIIPDAKVIDAVVMKCLEKDPKHRYQSVLELQKDLAMYLRKNYADLLKTSVSVQDFSRSASYCGDLVMINMLTGDIPTAYKYLLDFVQYSKGDVKAEALELSEQIKMRMEEGVTEIPDELVQKAEIIVHQGSVAFRK